MNRPRIRLASIAALAWVSVIAALTLRSDHNPSAVAGAAADHWYCVLCGTAGVADFLLNVGLFFPLGIALRTAGVRRASAWSTMVVFTLAIEFTQAHFLVGRDGTLGDVLANSAGGILGWQALPAVRSAIAPTPRFARRAVPALLLAMLACWLATAAAFTPAVASTTLVARLAAERAGHDRYRGTVASATFDGAAVRDGAENLAPKTSDTLSIGVDMTPGNDPPHRTASILRLESPDSGDRVDFDQQELDGILSVRLRGSAWRLHTPRWRATNLMDLPAGKEAHVVWRWSGDSIIAQSGSTAGTPVHRTAFRMSVASGWILIHPFTDTVDNAAPLWTAIWLALWFAPLGWIASAFPIGRCIVIAAVGLAALLLTGLLADDAVPAISAIEACAAFAAGTVAAHTRKTAPVGRPTTC